MEFTDLISSRHSIREYKNEKIEDEVLNKLIEFARLAPTSRNKKPCLLIPVTEKDLLEQLSESKAGGSQMLKNAAAAIVVAGDSSIQIFFRFRYTNIFYNQVHKCRK